MRRRPVQFSEPLWSAEEEPEETGFPKIFRLRKNAPDTAQESGNPDALLDRLRPVCRFSPEQPELYRNKEALIRCLQQAVPSYREFCTQTGEQQKNESQT